MHRTLALPLSLLAAGICVGAVAAVYTADRILRGALGT
jgi:hypothetical protein